MKRLSDETKKKLSVARRKYLSTHPHNWLGKHLSDEHKRKIGFANRWALLGRSVADDIKQKITAGLRRYYQTHSGPTKGTRLSAEHRRKISLSNKGRFHSEETKNKLSLLRTGKVKSKEHRKRLSESLTRFFATHPAPWTGKHRSEETRHKCSIAQIGKRTGAVCSFWKGGIGKSLYPARWRGSLKRQIIQRDNGMCQCPFCRGIKGALCVHHIDYDKNNLSENNLITLCKKCHGHTIWGSRPFYTFLFQNALANREREKSILAA